MGRVQTFDTDEVVRAVRALFWDRGFEDVSVPEIEIATGLRRSSLYHAFGSKRGLFDAAVQSYLDEVIRPRLRPLAGPGVQPGALLDYLHGLRAVFADGRVPALQSGCLLLNAATAPIGREPEIADVVLGYRRELHAAMARGVAAHAPSSSAEDQDRLARVCAALVVSAMVLARVDTDEAARTMDAAVGLVQDARSPQAGSA
ncbi:TetR/AcrR family transcriptional regulator [Kineococcus sp. GCM10028916]|uniref:TetR/AcrR family transcriptional regulator n=1 Tax=Kineococcus sp. GCM10028916 TaxID=3273394 RepID=UPI00362CC8D7